MKKITILLCAVLMALTVKAQERKVFIFYHDGTVQETLTSKIDSIKFSSQNGTFVYFTMSDAKLVGNTATFKASVVADATVTDKGICYSRTNNPPTMADAIVCTGSGTGDFTAKLSDLQTNTFYRARPYAIVDGKTYYGDVKTFVTLDCIEIDRVVWARYNLGGHGYFVDQPDFYGAYFQWGRRGDGHEKSNSSIYPGPVVSLDVYGQIQGTHPAYGKFITTNTHPYDWCSPQQNNLWNSGTEDSPKKTANDPCPAGWRVPTQKELHSLVSSGYEPATLYGVDGFCFGSGTNKLFFPAAAYRYYSNGSLNDVGSSGNYWSSTPNYGGDAYSMGFTSGNAYMGISLRSKGFSVRCVSE